MNLFDIEDSLTSFFQLPFDENNFGSNFLECFGYPKTTIKRLKSGETNYSKLKNSILQKNKIYILCSRDSNLDKLIVQLENSDSTHKYKVKILLITNGDEIICKNLQTREIIRDKYIFFADHFNFFVEILSNIRTSDEIRNNPIDVKATGKLNRLYISLLKFNPIWSETQKKKELNKFFSRLIFCFYAEDTGLFKESNIFTKVIRELTEGSPEKTPEIISLIFKILDTKKNDRDKNNYPSWSAKFPYVNGELFSGDKDCPNFDRISRSYLLHAGNLNWKEINPDIFGSMIQSITDDEERKMIGMHYTSVPNILKVLNPLFLNELREQFNKAGENKRKLKILKNRIQKIRVFDPACGSGNFLVVSYKELREIENNINQKNNETHLNSVISISNFRGIEIRDFSCEISRLALIIASYQCDEKYLNQKDFINKFLPLNSQNWIVCGNALTLDWDKVCPQKGIAASVEHSDNDLFKSTNNGVDFSNEGGEVYICSNPPYSGSQKQSKEEKKDLQIAFKGRLKTVGSADYVTGWFIKAFDYMQSYRVKVAFVTTNSINQGRAVTDFWPLILKNDVIINFAYSSFNWSNLAKNNATVAVNILGLQQGKSKKVEIFYDNYSKVVKCISPYLIPDSSTIIEQKSKPISNLPEMNFGNMPNDNGKLLLDFDEMESFIKDFAVDPDLIRPFCGADEFIKGKIRFCLWIDEKNKNLALSNDKIKKRISQVKQHRDNSNRRETKALASVPHRFGEVRYSGKERMIIIPITSSANRDYLPCGFLEKKTIVSNLGFVIGDARLWHLSILLSRIHFVWIITVCGKLGQGIRYSNKIGWNSFPIPNLTEKNIYDLELAAEKILLVREKYFPKSIAELYNKEEMPEDLITAHKENDLILERIYIGRNFENDSDRIKHLFNLYEKSSKIFK